MTVATLTSKGQITIPKSVRDSLQLHAGDKIAFTLNPNGETILKPLSKSVDQVYGRFHKADRRAVTVAGMNEAMAKRMRSRKP